MSNQIETVVLPPPAGPSDTVVVLSQRSGTPVIESSSSSSPSILNEHPLEMTNRVRHSKQRLASKQLIQPADIPTTDDAQPVGTCLNPAPVPPPPSIVKRLRLFLFLFFLNYIYLSDG